MEGDRLLTVGEVAEQLRLNPQTIRRWIASGRLHGVWLGTDRAGWRIRQSEVNLLLEGGQQTQQLPLPRPERPKRAA